MERSENTKNTKRLDKEEIKKQQLIDSLVNNDTIDIEELNEKADNVEKPADAADIIKEYGQILRTKRKGIVSVANYEGKVFSRFWEKKKFMKLVRKFGVYKNTILFKINIFKIVLKHPKLMKSSAT